MPTFFHRFDFLRRQAVEGIDVAVDLLLQLARVRAGVALLRVDGFDEVDDILGRVHGLFGDVGDRANSLTMMWNSAFVSGITARRGWRTSGRSARRGSALISASGTGRGNVLTGAKSHVSHCGSALVGSGEAARGPSIRPA